MEELNETYTATMQLLSMPDKPSRNGVIYTKESFIKALEKKQKDLSVVLITACPSIFNNNYLDFFNTGNLIGAARNIRYDEDTNTTALDVTFTNDDIINHIRKNGIDNYAIGMSYTASFNKDKTLEIDRIISFDLYNKDWIPVKIINNKVVE